MSALRIPIPVTRTPHVPIISVRTAVLANRGSLETGRLVKVKEIVIYFRLRCLCEFYFGGRVSQAFLVIFLYAPSDIDECSVDLNPCDENAECANIDGSYSCTCKEGFTGNGTTCEGTN